MVSANLFACGTIYPAEEVRDADVRASIKLFGMGVSKFAKSDSRFDQFDLIV
jgi:hypothetical protein